MPLLISRVVKMLILIILFSVLLLLLKNECFGGPSSAITEVLFSKVNLVWEWVERVHSRQKKEYLQRFGERVLRIIFLILSFVLLKSKDGKLETSFFRLPCQQDSHLEF